MPVREIKEEFTVIFHNVKSTVFAHVKFNIQEVNALAAVHTGQEEIDKLIKEENNKDWELCSVWKTKEKVK